jgi:hypothetical protein
MSHPQQPELSRNELGQATPQDAQQVRAGVGEKPDVGGKTAPTPSANQSEDERRSG